MNLGNIVRRAVSSFARSKSRTHTTTPTQHGTTSHTTTGHGHHSSPEGDLAKSAARVAKKKL